MAATARPGRSIPHLLSSLPSSSGPSTSSSSSTRIHKPIFIASASAPLNPPTSFYAITRSKLKFTPADVIKRVSTARHPSKIVGEAKAANVPNPAPVKDGRVGNVGIEEEGGRVRVSGRAWGRKYTNGKLVIPTSATAKVDGEIHGASKKKWVLVDQATIPKSILEELNQAIAADKAATTGPSS